jgi:mono/diheme cytochrome c family protein
VTKRARAARTITRAGGRGAIALLLLGGCTSNDAGPPVPVDPAVLYGQLCARCHGVDGRGDAQMKLQMPVRDFQDPEFRARAKSMDLESVIMAGRNQMPAFGGTVSAPKIQALAGYVWRLGAK